MWSRIRLAVQRVSLVAAASAVAITTGQQLGKDYTSLGQSESPSLNTHYSTALRNAIDQSRALIKRFKV